MKCKVCEDFIINPKPSTKESRLCRFCSYMMELFSLNGNTLKEYWSQI